MPVFVDEAMLLLNMGSYMSYALRFGFLNALYFLGGACLAIEGICFKPYRAFDGTPLPYAPLSHMPLSPKAESADGNAMSETTGKTENEGGMVASNDTNTTFDDGKPLAKKALWVWISAAVAAIGAIFLGWFTTSNRYRTVWANFISDSDVLEAIDGFSSKFAHSLGGLEVIAVLFVVVGLLTALGCCLVSKKKISPRWLSILLTVVVGVQVIFYNNQIVVGNLDQSGSTTQHAVMDAYVELNERLNSDDGSYFRVKDYSDKLTACAPFTGNANAFSVFSSVIDKDNFATYHLFAYKGNGKNSYKSAHNEDKINRSDEFGDSFMGYKYYFVPKSKIGNFKDGTNLAKYVKPYMITAADGEERQLVSSDGEYYVFENEIVFPSAYVLPSGEYRFEKPNEANSTYRTQNQQALYLFLRGKTIGEMQSATGSSSSRYVTPETARELSEYLWQRAADVQVGAGKITAKVQNAKAGEALFLNFVASKGYTVTVNGKKAQLIDNDLKFLSVALEEGENTVEFVYHSPYQTYALIGAALAIVGLCAAALVVKKTKLIEWAAPVIAWAGIVLATGLVAFFLLYPTAAWIVKLATLLL